MISVSSTAVYYYGRDEEIWVYRWPEGGEPKSTGQTKDELVDVAGGVIAQAGTEEGTVEFVTAKGTVLATDLPPGGYLSPDGSLFASVEGELPGNARPGVVVSDTSTGETTKLDLNSAGVKRVYPFAVGWSSNDTLMVKNNSGLRVGQVIACTVSAGKCDVVASVDSDRLSFFLTVPLS